MKLTPPSRSLERVALVLGLASSVCLVIAAFAAFGNPREAGWSRLNVLVSGGRDNVRAAWAALVAVDGPRCTAAAGPLVRWSSQQAHATTTRPTSETVVVDRSPLFDALFEASSKAEVERHDVADALALVEEALSKDADEESRAGARLRAVQLAHEVGRDDVARGHAERAATEIDPTITTGGTSTVLLVTLAALPAVPEADRVAFADPLVRRWTSDGLVFPDDAPVTNLESSTPFPRYATNEPHVEEALRARLEALCGMPDTWRASFRARDEARARLALRDFVGTLPTDASLTGTHWTVYAGGPELLAVRAAAPDGFEGQLVGRAELRTALRARLDEAHALPDGFALDVDGSATELGQEVGVGIELSPAWPRATLRHRDVASVLREAETRTTWLRAGLIVLGLFVAGASVATFLALRRERRLAEARTAFVAGVSHELRTPLASILLMSENLESGRAGANAARYHTLIRREVLRLRRLVDDVLDFSRLERGRRFEARIEDVELASWFDSLADEARAMGQAAGVDVRCRRGTLPTHAALDAEAIRRAVLNLVVNALRHSGSPTIDVACELDGDATLLVTVADAGCGLAARDRATIFEPFARLPASESRPGAGLGLAIVREIATAHAGRVDVRAPAQGTGAVFELRIPIGAESASKPARASDADTNAHSNATTKTKTSTDTDPDTIEGQERRT